MGEIMQTLSFSTNLSDIQMRSADRESIASRVSEFLKSGSITKLDIRKGPREERPVLFNNSISSAPSKAPQVAKEKEAIESAIRELSTVVIDGDVVERSSGQIARIMRDNGYKLRATSVLRIAKGIGVNLLK